MNFNELWPRQYAEKIVKLGTRKKRLKALNKVLPRFKELVKQHVIDYFDKRKIRRTI